MPKKTPRMLRMVKILVLRQPTTLALMLAVLSILSTARLLVDDNIFNWFYAADLPVEYMEIKVKLCYYHRGCTFDTHNFQVGRLRNTALNYKMNASGVACLC